MLQTNGKRQLLEQADIRRTFGTFVQIAGDRTGESSPATSQEWPAEPAGGAGSVSGAEAHMLTARLHVASPALSSSGAAVHRSQTAQTVLHSSASLAIGRLYLHLNSSRRS